MSAHYLAHCPTCCCTASGSAGHIDTAAPFLPLVLLVDREASVVADELRARGEYGDRWPGPPEPRKEKR